MRGPHNAAPCLYSGFRVVVSLNRAPQYKQPNTVTLILGIIAQIKLAPMTKKSDEGLFKSCWGWGESSWGREKDPMTNEVMLQN